MINIGLDTRQLDEIAKKLAGTEEQICSARTRALRKTAMHVRTLVKKAVASRERIPQKAIASRFIIPRMPKGADEITVWMGTWNVSPFAIGQPTQTRLGVRAGRRSYRGAFLKKIYTGTEKVWIRLRSPHYSPDLYPTQKQHHAGYRGNLAPGQTGRFPVVKAAIPIDQTVNDVVDKNADAIQAEFLKKFEQELNYEVFFKGM